MILAAICAGLHAWSYGQFVSTRGNKAGAIGIYALVVATVLVTVFWSMS
jgi:hypothetical protein